MGQSDRGLRAESFQKSKIEKKALKVRGNEISRFWDGYACVKSDLTRNQVAESFILGEDGGVVEIIHDYGLFRTQNLS